MGLFRKTVATCFWAVCALIMFYGCTAIDMSVPNALVLVWLFIGMGLCSVTLATLSALYLGNDD